MYIDLAINVFKAIYNYLTLEIFVFTDAFYFFSENQKRFLNLSDAVTEIMWLWEAELLDSLVLINAVVPGISVGG